MKRYLFGTALIFFLFLINSCAFDPQNERLKELGGGYYISYDNNSSNDGIKIVHTEDEELFKVIASNCINIYRDSNVIMFSKSVFEGDSINLDYFKLNINSLIELKRINKISFDSVVPGLEKIDFIK